MNYLARITDRDKMGSPEDPRDVEVALAEAFLREAATLFLLKRNGKPSSHGVGGEWPLHWAMTHTGKNRRHAYNLKHDIEHWCANCAYIWEGDAVRAALNLGFEVDKDGFVSISKKVVGLMNGRHLLGGELKKWCT